MLKKLFGLLIVISLISCVKKINHDELLSSWKQGNTKSRITTFVNSVVDPGSENFVPIVDRIAVFDNDGTLWSEKPMYFQLFFVFDRIKDMYKDHPEWKYKEPYKSVINNDMESLFKLGWDGINQLFTDTHTGLTAEEFNNIASNWFEDAKHPSLDRKFTELVFEPMLQLLDYLRENEFEIYIVSGGGQAFVRAFSEETYNIPKQNVIGTLFKTDLKNDGENLSIYREPKVLLFNDNEMKAVAIEKFIGKRPIIAFGNSDGDYYMLKYSNGGKYKSLCAIIHHTDDIREYAYDRHSDVGKLNKALDDAEKYNWLIVDMKNDWEEIYP